MDLNKEELTILAETFDYELLHRGLDEDQVNLQLRVFDELDHIKELESLDMNDCGDACKL